MRKTLVTLIIFSLIFITNAWSQGALDKFLQDALKQGDGEVDVIVKYKKQNSVAQLVSEIKKSTSDREEIGRRLRDTLRERAGRDQKNFRDVVERLKGQKKVRQNAEEFWLLNMESLRVDKKALRELQSHPDVDTIYLDEVREMIEPGEVRKHDSRKKGKGKTPEIKPGEQNAGALAGPVPGFTTFDVYGKQITETDKVHQLTINGVPIKGAGIKVAVLDTGVDGSHPEFRAGQVVAGASFISGESNPLQDLNNHGTHCAGTVGSRTFGMAPDCTIVAVKVLSATGSGSGTGIIQGIQFAVGQAVRVISMSLGTGSDSAGTDPIEQAVNNAVNAGVVVVCAAGNSGPNSRTVGSPGTSTFCVCVGASDQTGATASFSSRGPNADNAARPDLTGPGVSIKSTIPGGATAFFSGTSMATPHVAGIVALLLQAKSGQTPAQVKQVLLSTTTGTAIVNETGQGLVNSLKAINVVLPAPAPAPTPQPPASAFTQDKLIGDLSAELGRIFVGKLGSFRFFLAETPTINQSTRTAIVRLRIQNLRRGTITTVRVDMILVASGTAFNWKVTAQSETTLKNIAAQG